MPYAKRREAPHELNKAYAHVSENEFAEAANTLVDKLVAMGFDDTEARENIESAQGEFDEGLFAPRPRPAPELRHTISITREVANTLRRRPETGESGLRFLLTSFVYGFLPAVKTFIFGR